MMSIILNIRKCQSILRVSSCLELTGCSMKRFQHELSPAEKEQARNAANFKYDEQPLLSRIAVPDEGKMPFFVELRKRLIRKNGWTDHFEDKKRKALEKEHTVDKLQLEALGPDLNLAHFVLPRGGGVKFSNIDRWLYVRNEAVELPATYDQNFILTGVDISNLFLTHQALTFFDNTLLTHLSIARSPSATDWWLDFISGALPTLEHLDISGCQRITYRGISILYRCEKLTSLSLQGFAYSPLLEMTLLELEQVLPKLKIYGIDSWENDKNEGKSQLKESEASNQDLICEKNYSG